VNEEKPNLWVRLAALSRAPLWGTLVEWATAEYEMREAQILAGDLSGEELKYMLGQASVMKRIPSLPDEARAVLAMRVRQGEEGE